MATLQDIVSNDLSLTRSKLKLDKALVIEIQLLLSALGYYPGGGWIDGDLGGVRSFSWKGLINFCTNVGVLSTPSNTIAINSDIAQKLLDTKQVISIFNSADTSSVRQKLKKIQDASIIVNGNVASASFVARTINKSPFQTQVNDYPTHLAQKPDGTSIISYGDTFTLSDDTSVNFSDYPNRGNKPAIDTGGLLTA